MTQSIVLKLIFIRKKSTFLSSVLFLIDFNFPYWINWNFFRQILFINFSKIAFRIFVFIRYIRTKIIVSFCIDKSYKWSSCDDFIFWILRFSMKLHFPNNIAAWTKVSFMPVNGQFNKLVNQLRNQTNQSAN